MSLRGWWVRRRGFARAAALAWLCAAAVVAGVQPGASPETYLKVFEKNPLSPDAILSQRYLFEKIPEAERAAWVAKLRPSYEKFQSKGRPYVQACFGGVLLALGDPGATADALGPALNGDDNQRGRWLALLAEDAVNPKLYEHLPAIAAKAGEPLKGRLMKIHGAWAEAQRGTGAGTLLGLLLLSAFAGLVYMTSLVSNLDPVRTKILAWTNDPTQRDKMLRAMKEDGEITAAKLAEHFDDRLTAAETAGLLDLIARFDDPVTHEKVKQYADSEVDLVKQAAVSAMEHLPGPAWTQTLMRLLQEGDELQSGAAARALAERKDMEALPVIQAKMDAASGGLQGIYRDALERIQPKV